MTLTTRIKLNYKVLTRNLSSKIYKFYNKKLEFLVNWVDVDLRLAKLNGLICLMLILNTCQLVHDGDDTNKNIINTQTKNENKQKSHNRRS